MPTPNASNMVRIAFLMIDKDPSLTLGCFTTRMLETFAEDEFTAASFKVIFEEAKALHVKLHPDRRNLPLPALAFLIFKENGYNWEAAYGSLRKEYNLTHKQARDVILEAGLMTKD